MASSKDLRAALGRWCAALEAAATELNALDGQLGDGDLGTTLSKCAANVSESMPTLPDDIAAIFKTCASACAKASGSSFGTLLAVAFLTASKGIGDTTTITRADMVRLLDGAVNALAARGGAALGDKTMLDSIDAIARSVEVHGDDDELRGVAVAAAQRALDNFRDKPNRIGRARMFADKSIGMEDPGMVAILRMAQSL